MINNSCPLCGMLYQTDGDMCETCFAMMNGVAATGTGANPYEQAYAPNNGQPIYEAVVETNYFQPNYAAGNEFQPPQYAPHDQGFEPPPPEDFQTDYSDGGFQPDPPVNDFQPAFTPPSAMSAPPAQDSYSYAPPPMRRQNARPVEPAYKPSLWNWISELPTFVKIGAIVLIFALCFAFVLKKSMNMDLSVVKSGDLETQKPWFSSWSRSTPTAEEIFEKHESVTYSKGKKTTALNFLLTGKAGLLNNVNASIGVAKLKKFPDEPVYAAATPTPASGGDKQSPPPGKFDYDVTFELALKSPNKVLFKQVRKPRAGFSQQYVVYKTGAFDGSQNWSTTKTNMMSGGRDDDGVQGSNFYLNHVGEEISFGIRRQDFTNVELLEEDVVFNRRAYRVKTMNAAGDSAEISFDIETGLAVKAKQNNKEVYFLDYANFDGVMYPSKIFVQMFGDLLILSIDKVQSDVPMSDGAFRRLVN